MSEGMNTIDRSPSTLWWRIPLLVTHVVVAVGLIGATLVLVVLGIASLRGASPLTVYSAAHLVEVWVVSPLAVLALATGVIQALLTGRGLIRHWWVTVKLVITAAATAAVLFVLEPRLAAALDAALAGDVPANANRILLAIAPAMATALLVFNATLGIYKPEGRARRSHQFTH
jgi:hypothetical protein